MKFKRMVLLLVLLVFISGMLLAPASASHTFKKGKYKVTISNKEYNIIKKDKHITHTIKWTGKYKKVTTWKTKKMKTYESWIDSNGNLYKSKYWDPYKKFGYKAKYVKSVWKYYDDGDICWDYFKVPKTVKKKVYMTVSYYGGKWYKTVWTKG